MSTATRFMLSRALKGSVPRQQLLLPQRRGLAAQVDDKTARQGDEYPAHGVLKNGYFNTHHPISTAVHWGAEFWRNVPVYSNVSSQEFLSYSWSTKNTVDSHHRLNQFLDSVVPDEIPDGAGSQSKEEFMEDVYDGIKAATMSLRITQVKQPYLGL